MQWLVSPPALIVLGSALVAITVGVGALRERPDPMAVPLAILMFAVAAWAIPHATSFGAESVSEAVLWSRLRHPGAVLAPVAYLLFAIRYAGYDRWLTRRLYSVLLIVPVITLVVLWTNQAHGWYWRSLELVTVGRAAVLVPEYGLWYWINLGYLYSVTLVALALLANVALRSGSIYRKQASVMFVGGAVPLLVNIVMNSSIGPEPMVDLTTTALAVTGVTFALALFRFDLLAVQPVARDRFIDELDDGVVVIGPDGLVKDYNPTAAKILDGIEIHQSATDLLPSGVMADDDEIMAELDSERRRFRSRSTPLTDSHGETIGRIVYLNDVTELVERERRISVLNRVLRHNIRTELNVAAGRLDMITEDLSPDQREHVEAARDRTANVIEFAEQARYVEETIQASDRSVGVSAAAIVERAVDDARGTYPTATIEYEPPPADMDTAVDVVDDGLLEMAILEVIENAVEHHDEATPSVTVSCQQVNKSDRDIVEVRIVDDGPGIPPAEVQVLERGYETSMEHTSGLGLWLVHWIVHQSNGQVTIDGGSGGTAVSLELDPTDRD